MEDMEVAGVLISVYLMVCLAVMGLSVVQYVFRSLGLYTMAKRRGISKPWLAWVPVGIVWVMGCISDQYQYVARGTQKSKRTLLLWLNVALYIVLAVYMAAIVMMALAEVSSGEMAVGVLLLIGTALAMLGISVWYSIVFYMAQFDLYRSADPDNAVLYLVLGILLGSIVDTILIFICRNKDGGMPPRRMAEPVAVPQDPWQGNIE